MLQVRAEGDKISKWHGINPLYCIALKHFPFVWSKLARSIGPNHHAQNDALRLVNGIASWMRGSFGFASTLRSVWKMPQRSFPLSWTLWELASAPRHFMKSVEGLEGFLQAPHTVDAQKCDDAHRCRRYSLPLIRLDGDQETFAEQFSGLLEQHLPGNPFYRAQSRLNLEAEAQGKSLLTKREERVLKVAMDHIQKKGFDPSLTFWCSWQWELNWCVWSLLLPNGNLCFILFSLLGFHRLRLDEDKGETLASLQWSRHRRLRNASGDIMLLDKKEQVLFQKINLIRPA